MVGVSGGESVPSPTFRAMCSWRFVGLIATVAMQPRGRRTMVPFVFVDKIEGDPGWAAFWTALDSVG